MFVKAAQFSQQSPPRVQVHHLKNMSQLFWHRAWEPKFVSDPGPLAGSVTNCCPATSMNKVIFHSLCYSKIEQELYLKQESNILEINREKKLFCFINHKDKDWVITTRVNIPRSSTRKEDTQVTNSTASGLAAKPNVTSMSGSLAFPADHLYFPCSLQNGFRQNGTGPYQLLNWITYGCFPPEVCCGEWHLLFWLHLPGVWSITLFPRTQSCSCSYHDRQPWFEKPDPENEPYLPNKLWGLRWTSVSAFRSEVLLNSKLKKGREGYLVSPDGNMITADSWSRTHCSPLSRSSLSQWGKDGLATQATHADLLAFSCWMSPSLPVTHLYWADLPSAFITDLAIFPINLNQYTHTVNIPKFKSI